MKRIGILLVATVSICILFSSVRAEETGKSKQELLKEFSQRKVIGLNENKRILSNDIIISESLINKNNQLSDQILSKTYLLDYYIVYQSSGAFKYTYQFDDDKNVIEIVLSYLKNSDWINNLKHLF
jgi:hypothetical protein